MGEKKNKKQTGHGQDCLPEELNSRAGGVGQGGDGAEWGGVQHTHTCCKGMNLGGGRPVKCNSLEASAVKEQKGQVDHLDFEIH